MSQVERSGYERHMLMSGDPIGAIQAERIVQDRRWGAPVERSLTWAEWMLIFGEEYGEAVEAAGVLAWDRETIVSLTALREELIQVAAVAVAIVEVIDQKRADILK